MRKIILATLLGIGFFLFHPQHIDAAIVSEELSRNYQVHADKVIVTETNKVSVTDNRYLIPAGSTQTFVVFNPVIKDPTATSKIERTLPTIKVTDSAGKPVQFTTKIVEQNIEISTTRAGSITASQPQSLTVTYESYGLISKTGAIYDLYIPTFAKDYKFTDDTTSRSVSTRVLVPKDLGPINFSTPNKQPIDLNTQWQFDFTQAEMTGSICWIQIGTTQYYRFDIRQPYGASSNVPAFQNTYDVILPRDIKSGSLSQKVHFTIISPDPDYIKLDESGNLIATFTLPASQSGEILITGYAEVSEDNSFSAVNSGKISDIPKNVALANTASAQFWESDASAITQKAFELRGNDTDIYQLIERTYKYVIEQIDYSEVKRFGINERQGALKTLQGGAAVCMEYSDLFIALMRAQGIPARGAFGYGYDSRTTTNIDSAHQWAEVYLPAQDTWLSVDTTWGESGTAVIGGNLNHFFRYVAYKDPITPSPVSVSFYGNLPQIPDDKFEISAVDSLPTDMRTRTQSDLLTEFAPKTAAEQTLNSITRGIQSTLNNIDQRLTSFITENLKMSSTVATGIKILLVSVLIVLVARALLYPIKKLYRMRVNRLPQPAVKHRM